MTTSIWPNWQFEDKQPLCYLTLSNILGPPNLTYLFWPEPSLTYPNLTPTNNIPTHPILTVCLPSTSLLKFPQNVFKVTWQDEAGRFQSINLVISKSLSNFSFWIMQPAIKPSGSATPTIQNESDRRQGDEPKVRLRLYIFKLDTENICQDFIC